MDESPEGSGLGETLKVSAGLAETLTETLDVADEEVAPDKTVEVDTAGDDIAAGVGVSQAAPVREHEFIEHLGLDEGAFDKQIGRDRRRLARAQHPIWRSALTRVEVEMVVSPSIAKTRSHERIDGIGPSPVQRFDRSRTIVPIADPLRALRVAGWRAAIVNQMRPSLSRRGLPGIVSSGRASLKLSAGRRTAFGFRDGGRSAMSARLWPTAIPAGHQGLAGRCFALASGVRPPFELPAEIAEMFLDAPDFALADR